MENPRYICSGCQYQAHYFGFRWAYVTVPVLDREGNPMLNRQGEPLTSEKQGCVCLFCGEQARPYNPGTIEEMLNDPIINADCSLISEQFVAADYDGLDDEIARIERLNEQGIVESPREVDDDDPVPLL